MSILKPTDETNRFHLKQREDKNGTKMLIAARNDSLSRFTKELKQHQIPANKKVSLNLSTSQRAGVLLNGSSALGSVKENTRKKVNFDLPQISMNNGTPSTSPKKIEQPKSPTEEVNTSALKKKEAPVSASK